MPNLQDIERFKQDIRVLGRESELLEGWGESYEDIPPPEQGVPSDLSSLMESSVGEPGAAAESEGGAAPPDEKSGDLASFLDDLSLEPLPGMEEPESSLGAGLESPEDFFVPESPASVEELGKPAPEFEGLTGSPETEGLIDASERTTEPIPPEETGAVPEALLQGLAGDLESGEEGETVPEPSTLEFGEETPGIVEDLSAFEIPEPSSEESGVGGESEPAEESFSFEPPESPEGETFEFEAPEIPSQEPSGFGEFEIPEEPEAQPQEEIPLGPEEVSLLGGAESESGSPPEEEFPSFEIPEEPIEAPEPQIPEEIEAEETKAEESNVSEGGFEDFDFSIPEEEPEAGPSGALDETAVPEVPEETGSPAPEADFGELSSEVSEPPPEPGDGFDAFRLDDTGPSMPALEAGETESRSLDEELASLENDLTPSDNFNLESAWGGADFSIPGFETPVPDSNKPSIGPGLVAGAPPAQPFREPPSSAEEGPAPKVALTERQVDALQDTLLSYPLNLRLAIEEAFAEEKGTEDQRSRMTHLLVKSGTAGEAAALVSRILKRPISVPKGFEKRTGAELEAEKGSLRYILIHTVAPIAAMVLAVVLGLSVVGFLGYRFVYRPVRAETIYRQGYEEIRADRFPEADADFDKADRIWVHKRWYYRYAEAFAAKKQYVSAARKYDSLLRRWPNDRKGVLDYSDMEFRSRLDYPKAAKLLTGYIEARNYFDKEALLLLGDVYLEWAETDGGLRERLFEDARLQYSTLVERYGPEDPYMERMLRWFLRTDQVLGRDNSKEILDLKNRFMSDPKSRISSATLADLGGYLLDRGEVEDVSRVLLRAVDADPSVPEAHYELSRYFRRIENSQEERAALANAVRLLEAVENPTNRRIGMLVEALNRSGECYAELSEYVTAESLYSKAIQRYERALSLGQLTKNSAYGKAYANLADILFFRRDDLDGALALYQKAQVHGYVTPETLYKQGYVEYRKGRWEDSLESLYRAGLDSAESPYLLYATGNALFQREDYFAAQGYYSRLVDRLKFELDQLPLAEPQVRPSHGEIVDLLMRATNNLGVSLFRIGNRMGDAKRRAAAMAQFMDSTRYFDSLERDPATMIRPEAKNLAYLNLDYVLHPQRGIDLSIYPDLSKSMKFPRD